MNGLLATLSRELRAYFFSPLAWIVLTFFLLGNGVVFTLIVSYLSDPRASGSTTPLEIFFTGFFFWLVLLFITPILTMRLLAEERRSGTIESLMTAPVSETQVVVGKYLAALSFYCFLWLPTLAYVAVVGRSSKVDWGPIGAGYLGILGIGALFMAVGLFASSFTRSQIVAAIFTFAMLLGLFVVAFVEGLATDQMVKDVLGYLNLLQHMEDFAKGIVDTRRLVFYVSTSTLFLFLTSRVLQAKKWR
ncbi:MAG: ABC transporter permease subunit [Thermoanaerobaculia bacterium]|nr:ABC transporter permease subunit [Thermoanaerobaculia bacterium]